MNAALFESEAFKPRNLVSIIKHGGRSSIRLWGCFSGNGIGSLAKVDGMIKKEQYIHILDQNINQSAGKSVGSSKKIMSQSTCPRWESNCSWTIMETFWSGQVRVQTLNQLRICGERAKDMNNDK